MSKRGREWETRIEWKNNVCTRCAERLFCLKFKLKLIYFFFSSFVCVWVCSLMLACVPQFERLQPPKSQNIQWLFRSYDMRIFQETVGSSCLMKENKNRKRKITTRRESECDRERNYSLPSAVEWNWLEQTTNPFWLPN